MGSQLVYGDGMEDIKEFFRGALTSDRERRGGGFCSRPVVVGSLVLIWLFSLSIALIVIASRYEDLSVVSLSSRLDSVDSLHSSNHEAALKRISDVDEEHKDTVLQLDQTLGQVERIQGKVSNSLRELKYFLARLGRVAEGAAKQLEDLSNKE